MSRGFAALAFVVLAVVVFPRCTQPAPQGSGPDLVEAAADVDDEAAREAVEEYLSALASGDASAAAAMTTERFRESELVLDGVEEVDVLSVEADGGPYTPEAGQCAFRVECDLDFGKSMYEQNGVYTWWVLVSRDAGGTWLLDDAGL